VLLLLGLLGLLSFSQSRIYRSAETIWRDTIKKNPDCAVAHNNLGFCFWQKGDRPNALREVQTALALDPEFPDALNNLGNDSLDRGDPDTAISLLSKSVNIEPINASAHFNLGNAFLQKGDFDRAIAEYRSALSINPYAAPIHSNLGCVLIKKGNLADGIKELQITRDLQPDNPVYNINLAWVLASCADPSLRNGTKALEYAMFAVRGVGTNAEYLRILAAAYAQAGLFQEASNTATMALDLAQRNASPTLIQSLREELRIYSRKAPLP
jgi:Flp pilus assembly protein TadD